MPQASEFTEKMPRKSTVTFGPPLCAVLSYDLARRFKKASSRQATFQGYSTIELRSLSLYDERDILPPARHIAILKVRKAVVALRWV
jgi:hypothetical protein